MCLGMVAYNGQADTDFPVALYHEDDKWSLMNTNGSGAMVPNQLLSDPILEDDQVIQLQVDGGDNLNVNQVSDLQIYSPSE